MKIGNFKKHFFSYISKAEYTMALTSVVSSIVITLVKGYWGYLNDRNARIERLNNKPVNNIFVDYITYDNYVKMLDRTKWKPAEIRIAKEKIEEQKKQQQAKNSFIKNINSWLKNKTQKKEANDELDEESLKKLAEINNKSIIDSNIKTLKKQGLSDYEISNIIGEQNTKSIIGEVKAGILPPARKLKQEPVEYFVVYDGYSNIRYNPEKIKKSGKKQQIHKDPSRKIIGRIGEQNIQKDESIFDSIVNIYYKSLGIVKNDKRNIVYDTRYDRYGNRIKKSKTDSDNMQTSPISKQTVNSENKNSIAKIIDNAKIANNQRDSNENSNTNKNIESSNANNNLSSTNNKQEKKQEKYKTLHFKIDGELQIMNKYNNIADDVSDTNIGANTLRTIAYLEYVFEENWNKYAKKYKNSGLSATFIVSFDKNKSVKNVIMKNLSYDEYADDLEKTKILSNKFVNDAQKALYDSNLFNIKGITKKNYDLWKQVIITIDCS